MAESTNPLARAGRKPRSYVGNLDELTGESTKRASAPKPSLSRINLAVPSDLHRRFKAHAASKGVTMSSLLEKSIRDLVGDE